MTTPKFQPGDKAWHRGEERAVVVVGNLTPHRGRYVRITVDGFADRVCDHELLTKEEAIAEENERHSRAIEAIERGFASEC